MNSLHADFFLFYLTRNVCFFLNVLLFHKMVFDLPFLKDNIISVGDFGSANNG